MLNMQHGEVCDVEQRGEVCDVGTSSFMCPEFEVACYVTKTSPKEVYWGEALAL